jgi:hypothetical protein
LYKIGDEFTQEDPMTGEVKTYRVIDVKEITYDDGSTSLMVTTELVI